MVKKWTCFWAFILIAHHHTFVEADYFKLVSGLHMERIPSPSSHFYKEYVPLIYQFTIPRWKKNETRVQGSQNCTSQSYAKFTTTCPILFHLPEIHERFSEYLAQNQPLVVNLEDIAAKPETALINFDCELIQPHFEDIFMDKVSLDEYLGRLRACSSLGNQEFIRGIASYVYNVSGIYQEMKQNFYREYWLKIDLIDGRVDAAIWASAVVIFNSLLNQNYMMEANRWKMAVVDCEAGRIPSTIMPPSLLGDTLTDMLESLQTQQLVPTVSTDTVGNYYKSTLTDCTFTEETFVVRILVPVIPKQEKFLLVKVSPLPFYFQDPQSQTDWECQIDPKVLPRINENGEAFVIVDTVKNIAYESDCRPGKLCHIPTAQHPRKVSACATAAFKWDRYRGYNDTTRRELLEHCPIQCIPVNKYKNNLLKHILPSEFFWFNGGYKRKRDNSTTIEIKCRSNSTSGSTSITAFPVPFGSQSFLIGCDCSLQYQSKIYKPKPCNGLRQAGTQRTTIQKYSLSPVQWYSEDLIQKYNEKDFWNVHPVFYSSPSLIEIERAMKAENPDAQNVKAANVSSGSSNSLVIILTLVTLILAILVVAIGWRLYTLIEQLQILGFNINGKNSSYMISGSLGSTNDQQVSYRNMNSLVESCDNNSLLINEGH